MSTLTRAAVYTVRISAMTAAAPVLAGAAGSAATAKLAGWELQQLASSPLTAEAMRLRAKYRELTTPARQQGHAGDGRDRHLGDLGLVPDRGEGQLDEAGPAINAGGVIGGPLRSLR